MLSNWLPFLIYAIFAAAIPATMISMSFILPGRPVSRTRQRMLPFESGVSEGAPSRERRFTVSFYLTAILFILFDIEIVFLYPLAVQLKALGWFGVWELVTFVRSSASRTSTCGGRERSTGNGARAAASSATARSRRPGSSPSACCGRNAARGPSSARSSRSRMRSS